MRTLLLILLIVVLVAGAAALYLRLTTPDEVRPVTIPLDDQRAALLAEVPFGAEDFALIATAAAVRAKLSENPITRAPLAELLAGQRLPPAWALGGSDMVLWRMEGRTSYALRIDPVRALLARFWLLTGRAATAELRDGFLIIHGSTTPPMGRQRLDTLLRPGVGLPPADVLLVQSSETAAFPPMGRPAVSAIQVGSREVMITSRAAATQPATPLPPQKASLPRGAMLSAAFAEPPGLVRDLDRLLVSNATSLLAEGGAIVIYDVQTRTLLPRPRGLLSVPATERNRSAAREVRGLAEMFGEVRITPEAVLIAFDKQSAGRYLTEPRDAMIETGSWVLRIDPKQLLPALDRLNNNAALRLAAPRIQRAVRQMRSWAEWLAVAEVVEAEHSRAGTVEQLQVRLR